MPRPRCTNALTLAAMLSGIVPTAVAQVRGPATREARSLSIPAGPLDDALKALARQSGIQLLYSAVLVAPLRSRPVSGAPSVAAALAMLLDGTGLRAVAVTDDAFVIEKVPPKPQHTSLPSRGFISRPPTLPSSARGCS